MFSACGVGVGHSPLDNLQQEEPVPVKEAGGAAGDDEFAPTDGGQAEDTAIRGSSDELASTDDGGSEGGVRECDLLDGGCTSNCDRDQSNICSVILDRTECELVELAGAFTTVACGQTAPVGTANCGGCGSVAVDVYYDGAQCWEGIPDCALPQFAGKLFDPHAPGAIDGGVAYTVDATTGADAGTDAGADAGTDAGADAGTDADAGATQDAGTAADASSDLGADQGD
jgi:hypothetical protein